MFLLSSNARAATWVLALFAMLIVANHIRPWYRGVPVDFRAFVAAGRVIEHDRQDPYLAEPLTKEESLIAGTHLSGPTPAPLPPFDLMVMGWLARLPISAQVTALAVATLTAGLVTSLAISRCSTFPLGLSVAVVALGVLYDVTGLGNVGPIAIAAIAGAAWAIRAERGAIAGACLLVALIQPNMAAGAILATLIFVPSARIILTVGIVALAGFSALTLGFHAWPEYAHTLSLHARAELRFPAQYSLSWLLRALGTPSGIALLLGTVWSIVLAIGALYLIAGHRDRAIRSGAVVLFPAALSALGGTFVHAHQLAIAIVPAIIFVRPTRSIWDGTWIVAALTVPFVEFLTYVDIWPTKASWLTIGLSFAILWATVSFRSEHLGSRAAATKATAVTLGTAAVFGTLVIARPHLRFEAMDFSAASHYVPSLNASIPWLLDANARASIFNQTPYLIAVKVVIWAALIGAALVAGRAITTIDSKRDTYSES